MSDILALLDVPSFSHVYYPIDESTKLQQSFLYQDVKTWNCIPRDNKISFFSKFKSDSKQFFSTISN